MGAEDGARARILGGVRRALNRQGPLPDSLQAALQARLDDPRPNLRPQLEGDRRERFERKLTAVSGKFQVIEDWSAVGTAVLGIVERWSLPAAAVLAPDPRLDAVPWPNALAIERRAAEDRDTLSVTVAFAGVAETGTVVLLSGADSPTTLNFLPEDHVVVLPQSRLVWHLDDVWPRLRAERPGMPRTVNLITGPSRTADVEITIQEGAHGPRRLHVILVAKD